MAKIDTSRIEGYEKLTPEQKLAALEGFEYDDGATEIERYKNAVAKANSEAADYKKQLREKMTADELKAKEDAEKQEKYDALLKKVTISDNKARLLALGYEDALATEVAEAMVEGDTDKVFAAQKKHLESVEKKIRADILKDTPKPTGGNGSATITKETFSKMSLAEQYQFSVEHPEEYKKLYGGN